MQKVVLDMWMIKNSSILYEMRYLGIILDGFIYAKCYSITSVIDSNIVKVSLESADVMQPLTKEISYYTLRVNIDDDEPLKSVEHCELSPEIQKDVIHAFYAITPYLSKLRKKLY